MIKKKSPHAAFTLIELLVVITIIGILAGIALPVFNSVQVKGAQIKALAQAKQIGLALKLFASDNDGSYPQRGVPAAFAVAPANANSAFSVLFPTYTQSETIFWNKLAVGYAAITSPDNKLDATPGQINNGDTLRAGENVYAYVNGLNDSQNPSYPLIADGFATATGGVYTNVKTSAGGVWGGSKAVVIHLDNSGSIDNLKSDFTDFGNTGAAVQANIFTVVAGGWLDGCLVLNPIPFAR